MRAPSLIRVVYVAHPLGSGTDRSLNIEHALDWLGHIGALGFAPVAPWVSLAQRWGETPELRQRGLAIDFEVIARCDEVWLCGNRVSPGMQLEAEHAIRLGVPVLRYPSPHGPRTEWKPAP